MGVESLPGEISHTWCITRGSSRLFVADIQPAAGTWLEWHRKLKHKSGVERGFEGSEPFCRVWEKYSKPIIVQERASHASISLSKSLHARGFSLRVSVSCKQVNNQVEN